MHLYTGGLKQVLLRSLHLECLYFRRFALHRVVYLHWVHVVTAFGVWSCLQESRPQPFVFWSMGCSAGKYPGDDVMHHFSQPHGLYKAHMWKHALFLFLLILLIVVYWWPPGACCPNLHWLNKASVWGKWCVLSPLRQLLWEDALNDLTPALLDFFLPDKKHDFWETSVLWQLCLW